MSWLCGPGGPRRGETVEQMRRVASGRTLDHLLGVNRFFTDLAGYSRSHPPARLQRWWSEQQCARPGWWATPDTSARAARRGKMLGDVDITVCRWPPSPATASTLGAGPADAVWLVHGHDDAPRRLSDLADLRDSAPEVGLSGTGLGMAAG